jgi:hypothetical protein
MPEANLCPVLFLFTWMWSTSLIFSFLHCCQETNETTRICIWGLGVNIVPKMKTVHTKLTKFAVTIMCLLIISLTVILVPYFKNVIANQVMEGFLIHIVQVTLRCPESSCLSDCDSGLNENWNDKQGEI